MKLNSYLNFDGQTEAAFTRYAEVLGGKIEMMMRFGDVPESAGMDMGGCDKNGIMHASISLPGGDTLMASDASGGRFEKPQGFAVSISLDDVAEVNRIFDALSAGGQVTMPVQETFWSEAFGMVTDQWGTPWMLDGPGKSFG